MKHFQLASLSGHSLKGRNLVRMIYTDEAGISSKEPRCVVASVIVNVDEQFETLSRAVADTFDRHVPNHLRPGFHFHATEVFSGSKKIKREEWGFEERLDFLKEILSIPFVHDVPIAFGIIDKSWDYTTVPNTIPRDLFYHLLSFSQCMTKADLFLRKYLGGKENGTVVCEDIPQHRSVLAKFGLLHREKPVVMGSNNLRPNSLQSALGISPPPEEYRIDKIIDVPHFVPKGVAPMIQLADACAFAIRRWVNRESRGEELALAMLGPKDGPSFVADPVWYTGMHSGLANTRAYWTKEQIAEHNKQVDV